MITDEDLYTAARELTNTDLLPRLRTLIPDTNTILESEIGSRARHKFPPIPWNTPAAMLYYEIHADSRRYETQLTIRLFHHAKYRGGHDHQTTEAIRRLPVLIAHARAKGLPDLDVDDPVDALHSWPRRIRCLLGEAREGETPPMPVPGDAKCPYCGGQLWLGDGWQSLEANATAVCKRCKDAHGRWLSWPVTERLGKLQAEELVTIKTAAHRYGIKQSRMWKWKERGRIHMCGEDSRGRALYRVSDLLRLADQIDDVAS